MNAPECRLQFHSSFPDVKRSVTFHYFKIHHSLQFKKRSQELSHNIEMDDISTIENVEKNGDPLSMLQAVKIEAA